MTAQQTEKTSRIAWTIKQHRPSITLKSYGSNVDYCMCGRFIPNGSDEESWKDWARHVAEEIVRKLSGVPKLSEARVHQNGVRAGRRSAGRKRARKARTGTSFEAFGPRSF